MATWATVGYAFLVIVGAETVSRVATGQTLGDHIEDAWDPLGTKAARKAEALANQEKAKGYLITTTGELTYVPKVYGTRRIGGNEILRVSGGERTDTIDGDDVLIKNASLYRIVVHSTPVDSVNNYEVDEVPIVLDANGNVVGLDTIAPNDMSPFDKVLTDRAAQVPLVTGIVNESGGGDNAEFGDFGDEGNETQGAYEGFI